MWKVYALTKEKPQSQPKGRRLTKKLTIQIIDQIDQSLRKQELNNLRRPANHASNLGNLMSIKMMLMKCRKKQEEEVFIVNLIVDRNAEKAESRPIAEHIAIVLPDVKEPLLQ